MGYASKDPVTVDTAVIETSVEDYLTANPPASYTHPPTHPATMITEDETHRFVTDSEKSGWNGSGGLTQSQILTRQL